MYNTLTFSSFLKNQSACMSSVSKTDVNLSRVYKQCFLENPDLALAHLHICTCILERTLIHIAKYMQFMYYR